MSAFRSLPFLALVLTAPAFAQEADEESDDVIIVTGEGLPETPAEPAYSVREIARDQIVTTPSGRIEDALGAVAGFQQFRRSDSRSSNPSAQGVTLRALGGNATSRALVTLDGVPMQDPFFGYVPFAALVPEQIGSIRVTRGGGSGPFGAGALAGTIALSSADIGALGPVTASALVNDRGGTEVFGGAAVRLGEGFVTASGRWDRSQGFFTTPVDQRVPATARAAFDNVSGQIRAVAPLTETLELQARVLAFDDRRTLRFDGADSSASGQDASIRIVGRGDWEVDALAYVQARNFTNVVISSTRFVKVLDQSNTPTTGIGGKLEVRPPVGENHVLRIGVDYRRAEGELQEQPFSAFTGELRARRRTGGATSDLGFFIENDWTLGNLVLTGGLRADRTAITDGFFREVSAAGLTTVDNVFADQKDWTVTWRGGALFRAGESLSLRAAAYSGLRLPTLNELYRPFVVFPVVTEANAALDVERLEGFEAGLDWAPVDGVAFSLTAFDNRVENAVANVTLTPTLRQRQNLPAIDAQGLELGARVSRGAFSFDGTLAYTDAEVDGTGASMALDGNRPPQTPRWAAAATVSWKPLENGIISLTLRHVGAQFESDQETDVLPAATTLGAFVQVPLTGGFSLILRGENLTDETIVTRNSDGAIDLGVPRTVWGGVRYGF
ncbi:TonB-dependent receptor plug domain-containing protein [Erythrobacter litoralis]|uniref:TonB-dependent receptor, putative n=1 Tax=Erythrobacter litoralis (strain HTCC2594) TaxID=314225 RepID=Q2NDY0_ERYLH|nr:TonB-dependent receptor [Erythrobacter litoralis]ABC62111.1 TonB-dependent receptor, putative [Erythrobacter litoralis HTCC2594]